MFARFRFKIQSFQYCYRNLAKWLGMTYFAWRNTVAGNEHEVQNVKIDTRQLEDVMIAAVAAAGTKAQKRVLLFQDKLGNQTQFNQRKLLKRLNYTRPCRQRLVPSFSLFSVPATPVLLLFFLAASVLTIRQFCKFSKRGSAILLLAFVSLMSQTVVNRFHELPTQQAARLLATQQTATTQQAVTSNSTAAPAKPVSITLPASAAADVSLSLYSQFQLRYSSVTGACCCVIQFLSFKSVLVLFSSCLSNYGGAR